MWRAVGPTLMQSMRVGFTEWLPKLFNAKGAVGAGLLFHSEKLGDGSMNKYNPEWLKAPQQNQSNELQKTAEYFQQRRLSGAVLAANRVNFSRLDHQINVFQGHDPGKTFGDLSHFQNGPHHFTSASTILQGRNPGR